MPDGGGGRAVDGGGGTGGGGAGGGGGIVVVVDAGRPDSGILHPIQCGNTFCSGGAQFCCVRAAQPAICVTVGGLCPDSADRVYCDDRSDCAEPEVCCAFDFSNGLTYATCGTANRCNSNSGPRPGQALCDPTEQGTCTGFGNSCRTDNNAIIDGYNYCH